MKKVRKSLALDGMDCQVMPKSRRKSHRTEIRNSIMVSVYILAPTPTTSNRRMIYSYLGISLLHHKIYCVLPDRRSLCWFRSAPRQFAASSTKASWIRASCWVPVTVPFFPACNNHFLQVSPLFFFL